MLTGVAFQMLNSEGISDDEIKKAVNEAKTILNSSGESYHDKVRKELEAYGWKPVILKDNFEVWRKATRWSGIYQYKGK